MDWYSVDVRRKRPALPPPPALLDVNPAYYRADPGLAAAVNVAILLGQPLLVTGEPGTGKTMLAYSLAWQLGLKPPLVFETKSTSLARDLFYSYDAIGRFHAAQINGSVDPRNFITYNALGLAILRGNTRAVVSEVSPATLDAEPERSVVLIDEIDKAPRDFPNDMLTELAGMQFRIPELGSAVVSAPDEMRPIVIVTSNSEKNLPDAFLRRCVYYNIPFPTERQLLEIIELRLQDFDHPATQQWVRDALDLFLRLREEDLLLKKPSTAELLAWLIAIRPIRGGGSLRRRREEVIDSLGVLIKGASDLQIARNLATDWLNTP